MALVTGASRGIGREIALGLARRGLAVGLLARSEAALAAVVEEARSFGAHAAYACADVRDLVEVTRGVGHVAAQLGPIDLLVNDAGMVDAEVPLWEAQPEQWRRVVEVNLLGAFHVSRVVLGEMVERGGGREVDLASGLGARDSAVATAYTASKAALIRQVGSVHAAGWALGLRAFAVAPGVVATDMTAAMDMHVGRTRYTPVERTVEMVAAIARGELDAWSGRYLRADADTPASLRARNEPGERDRRLAVVPWGETDPLA